MKLVDVHAHLSHQDFGADLETVLARSREAGLVAVVCNGLDPVSNRFALDLAAREPLVRAALGIYPSDAVRHLLPADFPLHGHAFEVADELAFIAHRSASDPQVVAIGETGMDGFWLEPATFAAQEQVFAALVRIAMDNDLPVIVHSRKCEERCLAVLDSLGCRRVVMHCFGGKASLAKTWAESRGWCFSIPANARVNHGFSKLLKILPPECLLTETDSPYMGPVKGGRNEPANVAGTIAYLAELRGWTVGQAADQVWQNVCRVFGPRLLGRNPADQPDTQADPRSVTEDQEPADPPACIVCRQPAELDFEGVPVCRDCWNLQGSVCSGPLYRAVQEKRRQTAHRAESTGLA